MKKIYNKEVFSGYIRDIVKATGYSEHYRIYVWKIEFEEAKSDKRIVEHGHVSMLR